MRTVRVWVTGILLVLLATSACGGAATETAKSAPSANASAGITDQQVSDAYIYPLGRLLVLRQEQADFQEGPT